MFFILDKETRNRIKEETRKIKWEAKKKQELLNTGIDYNFLQSLIDRAATNNVEILINFKSGDRMTIRQRPQQVFSYEGYNGEPTLEEIR